MWNGKVANSRESLEWTHSSCDDWSMSCTFVFLSIAFKLKNKVQQDIRASILSTGATSCWGIAQRDLQGGNFDRSQTDAGDEFSPLK